MSLPILFSVLVLFTGLTIPLLPMLSAFFPGLGLAPLDWGHNRLVRQAQVTLVWVFAGLSFGLSNFTWGWAAILLALWFSFVAVNLYPDRIFVALEQPQRAQTGLADSAPVLATEARGEVVAYPLETLVPHHLINDILADIPVLASW